MPCLAIVPSQALSETDEALLERLESEEQKKFDWDYREFNKANNVDSDTDIDSS